MRYDKLICTLQNLMNEDIEDKEIALVLNVVPSTIAGRKKRNSEFKEEESEKIIEYFKEKLLKQNKNANSQNVNLNCPVSLPYYTDIYASCGFGGCVVSENVEKVIVEKKIIQNFSENKNYFIVQAKGDSNEPEIQDKDYVIIERYNGEQIHDNLFYMFRFEDNIFIKKLSLNIDRVIITSANPRYEEVTIFPKEKDFEIYGKIVGIFRNEF